MNFLSQHANARRALSNRKKFFVLLSALVCKRQFSDFMIST